MFLSLSKIIDNDLLLDNYSNIRKDYNNFVSKDYLFDYSHDYNLVCNDLSQLKTPEKTDYFWKVCPLIISGKPIPIVPQEVQSSFTTNFLLSFEVKPVLAVFSLLEPHSEVEPHFDTDDEIVMKNSHVPFHLRKTCVVKYHYSIDIPDGNQCGLTVLDETRILKNKDLNPFVETSMHSAFNRSDYRRGVLIISYLKHHIYPEII
jgi:hypothetical protein